MLQPGLVAADLLLRDSSARPLPAPAAAGDDPQVHAEPARPERHLPRGHRLLHDHAAVSELRAVVHSVSFPLFVDTQRGHGARQPLPTTSSSSSTSTASSSTTTIWRCAVRNDGGYVEKVAKGWLRRAASSCWRWRSPIDPSLDVGKSSFNVKVGKRSR